MYFDTVELIGFKNMKLSTIYKSIRKL